MGENNFATLLAEGKSFSECKSKRWLRLGTKKANGIGALVQRITFRASSVLRCFAAEAEFSIEDLFVSAAQLLPHVRSRPQKAAATRGKSQKDEGQETKDGRQKTKDKRRKTKDERQKTER